jgi:hypothetical protein
MKSNHYIDQAKIENGVKKDKKNPQKLREYKDNDTYNPIMKIYKANCFLDKNNKNICFLQDTSKPFDIKFNFDFNLDFDNNDDDKNKDKESESSFTLKYNFPVTLHIMTWQKSLNSKLLVLNCNSSSLVYVKSINGMLKTEVVIVKNKLLNNNSSNSNSSAYIQSYFTQFYPSIENEDNSIIDVLFNLSTSCELQSESESEKNNNKNILIDIKCLISWKEYDKNKEYINCLNFLNENEDNISSEFLLKIYPPITI